MASSVLRGMSGRIALDFVTPKRLFLNHAALPCKMLGAQHSDLQNSSQAFERQLITSIREEPLINIAVVDLATFTLWDSATHPMEPRWAAASWLNHGTNS